MYPFGTVMAINGDSPSGKNRTDDMVKSEKSTLAHVTSEAEKSHIEQVLKSTRGNRTRAAVILGISRKSLWEKIKAYNIEVSVL